MTISQVSHKALAWLRQTSAERRATLMLNQMSPHALHDIGIDRGGIDYAVRKGRVSLW